MDSLSNVVEKLAQSIQRSVIVDDADLRLLAHSTHFDDADPIRLNTLARRRVEGPVREATYAGGFPHWREPTYCPPLGAHGHEYARMAFPLRTRYGLLGVMWMIVEKPLSEEEMQSCLAAAGQLGRILLRRQQTEAEEDQEVEGLLLSLLFGEAPWKRSALRDLRDLGIFGHSTHATVLALSSGETGLAAGEGKALASRRALKQAVRQLSSSSAAFAVTEDGAFVVSGSRGTTGPHEHVRLAERIIAEAALIEPSLAQSIHIGIGSQVLLEEASESYDQAVAMAGVARRRPERTALWEEHPLEALLAVGMRSDLGAAEIPAVLRDVVEKQPEENLATVACFLDEAGNASRTAELLHLHRTTVYYRLKIFQQQTGLSLDDGHHRLMLHLWFRMRERALPGVGALLR